ncbi:copper chaperone PCu(A)C [Streptantibioticus parmotrematis]|uniref:copper chaperone PCu(A)C n=1 Tax=Streptantibioticus parmotrematis TaxID=2873249 RepID=UPI0033C903CA
MKQQSERLSQQSTPSRLPRRLRPRPALVTAVAGSALCALALSACGGPASADAEPKLAVSGAYVPQPPMADMAAGYFTVTNTGGGADALTSVTSDAASSLTLMRTTSDGEMQGVKSLPIPANGKLTLSTGGNHLMLMGLKRKPTAGQSVTFELHFAKSAPVSVRVPVEPATYQPKG